MPRVCVFSKHPIALQVIADAFSADPTLCSKAEVRTESGRPRLRCQGELLVVDSCSEPQWLEIPLEWEKAGGHVIVLVPQSSLRQVDQVRSLSMGVRGIVSLSADLKVELPNAVRTVLRGGFWIGREILDEYVRRTNGSVQRVSGVKERFTSREEQVTQFVVRGYSNKEIASALKVSERTIKYHVSNILQKTAAGNRRELSRSIDMVDLFRPPIHCQVAAEYDQKANYDRGN